MSDWRDIFEQRRDDGVPRQTPPAPAASSDIDDVAPPPDPLTYRPWILQRGNGRPVLFLDLRRFEPRTGTLMGCQMGYPYLSAIDYIGEQMLSLDFGSRKFVIEGEGLQQLAQRLQQGSVLAIQEYATRIWQTAPTGPVVRKILQAGPQGN